MRVRNLLRTIGAAVVLAGSMGAGACAKGSAPPVPEDVGAIMLYVDNHGWDDMTLFVLRGDSKERIGQVRAAGRFTIALDKYVKSDAGQLRVVAQPMGTRNYGPSAYAITQYLALEAGQTVLWTIEKDLNRSFLEIR